MRRALASAVAGALLLAAPGLAEVRRLEVVGAVALPVEGGGAPRQAAVQAALQQAVDRVARDLLREDGSAAGPDALLPAADPTLYTLRYRVLEDRGERRALLAADPGAGMEYVVLVEAHVDVERVVEALREAGWLDPGSAVGTSDALTLILVDVPSYSALTAVRGRLLAGAARSVVPTLFEAGRVELRVETALSAERLLDRLLQRPPEGIRLEPLAVDPDRVRVRVRSAW